MRRAVNVTRAERGTITIISCGLRSSSPSVPTTRVGAEDESGLEAVISRSYVQVDLDTKRTCLPILAVASVRGLVKPRTTSPNEALLARVKHGHRANSNTAQRLMPASKSRTRDRFLLHFGSICPWLDHGRVPRTRLEGGQVVLWTTRRGAVRPRTTSEQGTDGSE